MGRTGKTVAVTLVVTLLLLVAGALGFIYSGVYDVAADRGHSGLTSWILGALQERSVAARLGDVPDPPATDSTMLAHGFDHFHAMCVDCHGAPGIERGELGQGMAPTPPDLAEEAAELTSRELFWITKHGIKLAGMPAFGPTHSDEDIWGIVAFVERLPDMTPETYQAWVERLASGDGETGHTHAPGTPAHEH